MESIKINGRIVFMAVLFVASVFVLGIKLLNPTPIQIFIEGQNTAISQIEERKRKWLQIAKTLKQDQQKIYKAIIDSDGIIEQSELPEKTGLSKASVSRALDLLESRGLIEKRRRGMGNTILLK